MATFNYVKKDGTLGTFQATDSNVALGSLPTDAAPTSGVMLVKDTVLSGTVSKPISTPVSSAPAPTSISSTSNAGTLATQLGTTTGAQTQQTAIDPFQAPAFPSLPSLTSAQLPPRELPTPPQAPDLTGLADALDYAGQLAKTKRNELLLGVMMPTQGVTTTGDFGNILNNLNRAGVSFIEGQANNVFKSAELKYSAEKESFNRAYELALSDYNYQRALLADDVQAQRDILLTKWQTEMSIGEKNYDLNVKQQLSQQEEVKQQAQQEKSSTQELAANLASSGAPQDIVNAVLNSGNLDSAISIASGWLSTNKQGQYELRSIGGDLYQIETDPKTGQVINQKVVISGGGNNITNNNTSASNRTMQVIDGFTKLSDLTPTKQQEVRDELYAQGFGSDTPPTWFREYIQSEKQQTLTPQALQEEWIKYRDRVLGGGQTTTQGGGLNFDNL